MAKAGTPKVGETYPLEYQKLPLFLTFQNRDASSKKDQRIINVIIDSVENPLTGNKRHWIKKRPGLSNHSQPTGTSAAGRGVFYWKETDTIYSVFDQKVYADTSDTGITVSVATGTVYFKETNPTDSNNVLTLNDGSNMYVLTSTHSLTVVNNASDADFPASNTGRQLYFDTYMVVLDSKGNFYNSDFNSGVTSWSALAVQATERYQDEGVVLGTQKDQIFIIGSGGTEFYFNNQDPYGSPFLRHNQNSLAVGCASITTYAQKGDYSIWVSSTKDGGLSVWQMDALAAIERVSNDFVERILAGETITNVYGYLVWDGGNLLYCLNCPTYGTTLVYDVTEKFWGEWNSTDNDEMKVQYSTEKDGVIYLQGATSGRIYTYSPTTYQDSGTDFTVTIQTQEISHDVPDRKFSVVFDLEGDTVAGSIQIAAADDGYTTYNSLGSIDMSQERKYIKGLGSYYRRSWKATYTSNTTLRLEAFGEYFKKGNK